MSETNVDLPSGYVERLEELQDSKQAEATPTEAENKAPVDPKPIAGGGETEDAGDKPYWPDDWRTKVASHASAGDEKVQEKLLRQLERYKDPTAVYSKARELEERLSAGNLVRLPGEDASEEEIADWRKTMGVPETVDGYFEKIELENGAVLGDDDKPLATSFAEELHKANATPQQVNAALNWYYKNQEEQAAVLDEMDDQFRRDSERELKDEFGASYKRITASIPSLFAMAPGGTDPDNEESVMNRLLAGRTADGKIVGNDPAIVHFLSGLVSEINPASVVMDDGDQSGTGITEEIAEIEKMMRTDRRAYFADQAIQDRYQQLLEARQKIQERS